MEDWDKVSIWIFCKEIIEEFLSSRKAFFRDVPTVSITQLRAFGFSAVIYNTWSRRSGTRRTAYLHDSKTVCSGESRRWKLRKNSGWLISGCSPTDPPLFFRRRGDRDQLRGCYLFNFTGQLSIFRVQPSAHTRRDFFLQKKIG